MDGGELTGLGRPARRHLHPLTLGESLDVSLKLYRDNATTLWKIVAVVIVPLEALEVIVRRVSLPSGIFVHDGALYTSSVNGSSSAGGSLALVLVAVLAILGQLLATGAVFKLLLDHYLGRGTTWEESFAFARDRFGPLLWLAILCTVLVGIGFVLFVIPGIWLIVVVSVAVPALMLEGVKGFEAVKRSVALVRGRWWATFGRLFGAFLLYAVVAIVLGAISGAITRGLSVTDVTLYLVVSGIFSGLIAILLSPFTAAVLTVNYIDLRVRKEGLDQTELAASGFGHPPDGATVTGQDPYAGTSVPPPTA